MIALLMATALTVQQSADLRCVAVIGIVSGEQVAERGFGDIDPVSENGMRFAAIVGERLMIDAKLSRDAVRDRMLREAAAVRRGGRPTADAVRACVQRMAEVDPAEQ